MERVVFVDLDGVVADFVGGVCRLHGIDTPKFNGEYDIGKVMGMSTTEFWGHLDSDETFWADLGKTSEADEIMSFLEGAVGEKNIYFLSSPALNPACHSGKATWVKEHYGGYINRLILCGHKHFLASRGRLLIDDNERNCKRFAAAGGNTFLWPRSWNGKGAFEDRGVEIFKKEIRRFV